MWPIKSAQLSGPTEIFYITQIQKLRILTQKNIPPPPQKKALFFFARPLNPGITWAEKNQTILAFLGAAPQIGETHTHTHTYSQAFKLME